MQSAPYTQTPDPSATLLGETVWFTLKVNTKVMFDDLGNALEAAGLDKTMARALAPSRAFVRALRAMARAKLVTAPRFVDRIDWSAELVTFQISQKVKVADGVDYCREAVVTLDKTVTSGDPITCSDPAVKAAVDAAFAVALVERRTSDVTRLIRRILDKHRNKTVFHANGKVYFVSASQKDLVDKLESFVTSLGGSTDRWAIFDGVTRNTVQMQTIVVDSFEESVREMRDQLQDIRWDSTAVKVRNAQRKLEQIALDLQYNERRIGDSYGELVDYLAQCEAILKRQTTPPEVVSLPYKESDCDGVDDGEDVPASAIRLPVSVAV